LGSNLTKPQRFWGGTPQGERFKHVEGVGGRNFHSSSAITARGERDTKTFVYFTDFYPDTYPRELDLRGLEQLVNQSLADKHRLICAGLMTTYPLGYGRVSTLDHNLDAQADALTAAGENKVFIEKITGTKASRPELDNLREQMRESDVWVVTRLDRLIRSTGDLLEIASELQEKNVALEVTEHSINTSTPEGKLTFTMVPAFAECEHSLMVARPKDGLATARAQTPLRRRRGNTREWGVAKCRPEAERAMQSMRTRVTR